MRGIWLSAAAILPFAAVFGSPALAQGAQETADSGSSGGIQEIVVTAQKRAENVQDVPIAISAFTSQALQERAVTSVAGLSNISPNVTLDAGTPFSGSSAVLSAFIRGIGANDFAFNIDPGVGVYLDGVYLARSVGANQDLGDVERIEVLKGPQGTLFGRNTIGGAISIVTHDPGDEFRFKGDVMTGSYNLLQARGTADIPLAEGLTSSVSFAIKNRDGYLHRIPYTGGNTANVEPVTAYKAAGYDNIGPGTEGGDNNWSTRVKLVYDPGSSLRFVLSGDYSKSHQSQIANKLIKTFPYVFAGTYNCAIAGRTDDACGDGPPPIAYAGGIGGLHSIVDLPGLFGVNVDADPNNNRLPYDDRFVTDDIDTSYANGNNFSQMKNYGVAGTLTFDLSEDIQLKSISAYRELHWLTGMDLDGSPLNFLHTSFEMNQWQFSQELQLLGSALDKRLHYVLGAYYFKEAGDLHDYVTFAQGLLQVDGPNTLATENYAVFGQVDFRPVEQIGITIGGRYTHENKSFEGGQSDANGMDYKLAQQFGVPECAIIVPISEACRIAVNEGLAVMNGSTTAGYPVPGQPLRYYVAGMQHKKFNNFSPKIGVQYHPNDDIMLYVSWSKGYKTGGWTTRLSAPLDYAPDFNEEKATTWELGAKSTLLDRHLQVNAAVFQTDYKGIQLNFQENVSPVIKNAGDARIKGFELEVVAAPADGLTITGSVGYLDAHYIRIDTDAQVTTESGVFGRYGVVPGATLPKTPTWKFNISPRLEVPLGNGGKVIALGDYTHSSSLKNDTEGYFLLMRGPTDVLNASLTYREPNARWDLTVGGTNLTNDRYLVTGQAQFAGGVAYGTYSRPAEWYARLAVQF